MVNTKQLHGLDLSRFQSAIAAHDLNSTPKPRFFWDDLNMDLSSSDSFDRTLSTVWKREYSRVEALSIFLANRKSLAFYAGDHIELLLLNRFALYTYSSFDKGATWFRKSKVRFYFRSAPCQKDMELGIALSLMNFYEDSEIVAISTGMPILSKMGFPKIELAYWGNLIACHLR